MMSVVVDPATEMKSVEPPWAQPCPVVMDNAGDLIAGVHDSRQGEWVQQ